MDVPAYHLKESIFYTDQESLLVPDYQIPAQPTRELIRMYQLKERSELKSDSPRAVLLRKKAIESYDETEVFMQKEQKEILPYMYGTGGPEWS